MNDLVFIQNEQALTTSLKVAKHFEKRHDNVIRDIRTLINQAKDILKIEEMFFESTQTDSYGRQQPIYYMNRKGFTLLAMRFTGKKALVFQSAYIDAFDAMERKLSELLNERKNQEWLEARKSSKQGYKELSDTVRKLYLWAVEHGCKTPEKVFYMNFAKLMNNTLGIQPNSRDQLEPWQLYEIDKLQSIAKIVIEGEIAKGSDYHTPYKSCKTTFNSYALLSYIPQRLALQNRKRYLK